MSGTNDEQRHIESIEEMSAAPEADEGTRDADAPSWAAATEGRGAPPDRPHVPVTAEGDARAEPGIRVMACRQRSSRCAQT